MGEAERMDNAAPAPIRSQVYTSAREALTVAARRSLCFPLCRNWRLTKRVVNDVKDILALGRKGVVKAFLVCLGWGERESCNLKILFA